MFYTSFQYAVFWTTPCLFFYNSLSAKQKLRLDKIKYTAAKIVSGALHLTSKERLYNELGWETIQSRAQFLGVSFSTK